MNRITGLWTRRRLVTKVNLIIGTVLTLVFAYIATIVYFGASSQVRYDSNDFPGAERAATTFLALSPLERHIGYFNRGTAKAAVGSFEPAQEDLETALDLTPPRDECAVRINLSYVYEKLADQIVDQDEKKSGELYDQALQTLADAPAECRPDNSESQQKSDEATERVQDKKDGGQSQDQGSSSDDSQDSQGDDQQNEGDSSGGQTDQGDQGQNDQGSEDQSENSDSGQQTEEEQKRDELRQRGEDSNREQQQQGPFGSGGRTTPDKPW
ncbi:MULTISPECIES: hypothetical protein [unclassified Brevibacterium]|uniref:hypothetical protein n=1 Tax=unclassified Brevibacterium TaxID=2614124 RepID=UPI0010F9921C|nr:hypothetical protein [Brevibacterium sp. 2SA]MCM1011756.1 hypothetical protein [Brevibacterium sp. XM4083]